MAPNFGDIFDSYISSNGGQNFFFFGIWFFSDKSNIIPKNEETLSWPAYKNSNFAWFLQTVALKGYFRYKMTVSSEAQVQNIFIL